MKILLVGAGAVGQVYGYHFQHGGADVSFYVKEKHVEECRRGFDLYPLNRRNPRSASVRFEGFGVLSQMSEVAASRWDAVVLCMSSTGLRSSGATGPRASNPGGQPGSRGGEWLPELARAIGDATLVTLQPGIEDRDYVRQYVPDERLVVGMISLISYHAPLPGEQVPRPGMAYWFPPLSPGPFSSAIRGLAHSAQGGPEARARAVVETLARGGMPVKLARDVEAGVAFPSAALNSLLCALEAEGWSFARLRASPRLGLAARGAREAFEIAGRKVGARPPALLRAGLPLIYRFALTQAGKLMPLDLETYIRVHFTKVGDQTRLGNEEYIRQGKAAGLPTSALEELRSGMPAL